MRAKGVEISRSMQKGSKPVTKVEIKSGATPRRRRARLVCPTFRGGGRAR